MQRRHKLKEKIRVAVVYIRIRMEYLRKNQFVYLGILGIDLATIHTKEINVDKGQRRSQVL